MSPPILPTPAPSAELLGKRSSLSAQIDTAFSLPPAAIATSNASNRSSSTPSNASDSSYRPLSPPAISNKPSKAASTRRRYNAATTQQNAQPASNHNVYTLPPPPTRSRKIIQMKPRAQQDGVNISPNTAPNKSQESKGTLEQASTRKAQASTSSAAGQKRKQGNGATTAAGKKMARRTAHSLIERRRRSKMNEEFAVMKDMIPACSGQDMHKLQILSASIEYMRYLETCLADLKAVHARCPPPQPASHVSTPTTNAFPTSRAASPHESDDEVLEATPPQQAAPQSYHHNFHSNDSSHTLPSLVTSVSPAILPSIHTSPALSSHRSQRGYSFASHSGYNSALPSPAFDPQQMTTMGTCGGATFSNFRLTSPAIESKPPTSQDDHEATAALLMLNNDRRSWSSPSGARGMSVRDLLSS